MAAKSGVSLGSIKRFEQIGEISLQSLTKLAITLEVEEEIADGFSISPFSLPLEKKVFMPKIDPFDGIFGVFADSLPDGWGRLLVDSLITKASLGTSPISSIPYVLSLNFAFTLGNFTIFFSVLLILLQILILRKNFKLENILQIPVSEKVLL